MKPPPKKGVKKLRRVYGTPWVQTGRQHCQRDREERRLSVLTFSSARRARRREGERIERAQQRDTEREIITPHPPTAAYESQRLGYLCVVNTPKTHTTTGRRTAATTIPSIYLRSDTTIDFQPPTRLRRARPIRQSSFNPPSSSSSSSYLVLSVPPRHLFSFLLCSKPYGFHERQIQEPRFWIKEKEQWY